MKKQLNKEFWDTMYRNHTTGWDMGGVAPPFEKFFLEQVRKNAKILIPGAGNAHEANYLLKNGFTNVSIVDISSEVCLYLAEKFKHEDRLKIYNQNFFDYSGSYDYIFEQTFFCAIERELRENYVIKMHQLLQPNGSLVGVLFNRDFPSGPPFGGSKKEYISLLSSYFDIEKMEYCYNSHPARQGSELWINLKRKNRLI